MKKSKMLHWTISRSMSLFALIVAIVVQSSFTCVVVNAILLEKFTVNYPQLNERWEKYQSEEGKVYFWSETNKKSQWEDPRENARAHEEEEKLRRSGATTTTTTTTGNSHFSDNDDSNNTNQQERLERARKKYQEDEERRRQTRIAYEEEQQRKLEREQVRKELETNAGAERIMREAEERKREEERRKQEESVDLEKMRREKMEAKERAERIERERLERMEYMKKEKERKEQLRRDTERKEKERIEMQKREMEKRKEERERLLRAAKLVEEEKEREEEKRRRETEGKTGAVGQQQQQENKPNPFSYTTPKTPTESTKKGNDSTQKQQQQQQQHAAPNPLPEPEHHDDVNPDHALNLDDHVDAPKRHAPFVDGVVAQFFIFVVTTLSIWFKTLFRKIHEYRLAKQQEREENEKENEILGGGGGSGGSQIFGSPSRNRSSNGMMMNGSSNDSSRSSSVFNSPVSSNPSANHDLEDQRVKYTTGGMKKRQYLSRRASQLRIMLIDVNNAQGIMRKWKILGMYFQRLMKSSEIFFLARLFISFYYFNAAAEKYAYYVWRFKYYEFNKEHGFPRGQVDLPIGVPYGALLVVVITTLMVHDIKPSMCCVYLLFWDMRESIGLTKEVFFGPNGIVFNELAMKKLSVLGSTTLLLVNTIHSRRSLAVQSTDGRDGLLFSKFGNPRTNREAKPSKLKSIALALARLALASAFIYVGWEQVTRIAKNDMDAYSKMKENEATGGSGGSENEPQQKDGHDSNWLLVQFILAFPLFLGLRTKFVCRLMALSLFLEAFLSWDFWNARTLMPEHARTHFVVNLSCAGGMLLLQMFGAGAYSFDAFLLPKKIV